MRNVSTLFEQNIESNGNSVPDANSKLSRRPWKLSTVIKAVDVTLAENITLNKSTIYLIGGLPVLLTLILTFGGSLISWARNDQTNVEVTKALQKEFQDYKQTQQKDQENFKDLINTKIDVIGKNQDKMDDRFGKIEDGFNQVKDLNNRLFGAKIKNLAEQP